MSAGAEVGRLARSAERSRPLRLLARGGFAASALIHLLIGFLAIRVALHQHAESDQSGAIAQVGRLPGGPVLLWVLTIGLFALALWLVLEAVSGIGSASKRWARTLVSIAKAIAYLALAVTALTFARGSTTNAKSSSQHASSHLLALPGGQILLAVVGLIALGVGVYMIVKGARRRFLRDIDEPRSSAARSAVVALGVVGYIAKGIAVGVVGVLFVVAAITLDPNRASGLDGALKALVALPFGVVLLLAVGVGLVAFGAYTFARARFARL